MHKKDEEIEQLVKSFEVKTLYISILLPQDKKSNKGKKIKQKKVIKPNISIEDNYYDKGFDGLQSFQGNIIHRQKEKQNNLIEIEAKIKEILNQKQAEIQQYNETVNIKLNQDVLCENDFKKESCQKQYLNQKQQNEKQFFNELQSLQVENSHIFSQNVIELKKNIINDRDQNMRHIFQEQNNINLQNKCIRQDNQLLEQDLYQNKLLQFQQSKQQNGDFSPLNLNSNSSKGKTYNNFELEQNKDEQLRQQKNYLTQIKLHSENQIGQDKSESESEKENQIMSNYSDLSQLQSKSPKIEQNNLKSPLKYGNNDNIKNKQKDQINVNNIFDNNCEIKNKFLDHVLDQNKHL
ncbi:hypothetical protein PPERSA_00979 [Pseudocohnilembus persalinus]|uniref:Uncharacterized protein n=1 Tax=Pseudocohnilembus persalinus TaxID=266149 RepID=A0A0V0R8K7_PSEPJ|nr:hypothetical protein PPERSA_00979 [Pseudocohnilembus persalinus]|eukprot:KRX10809.1 hypothetical protein PPERSA_00979 [Pseudocohnilembus persalinus]